MESTKRFIKLGLFTVIAVSIIALASVVVSFASQEVTEEAASETLQETVVEKSSNEIAADSMQESAASNPKYTFDVEGFDGLWQCYHSYSNNNDNIWHDEYLEFDPNTGIEFEYKTLTGVDLHFFSPNEIDIYAKGLSAGCSEYFEISPIRNNDNVALYIDSFSDPDSQNVINVSFKTWDSFMILAYLYDEDEDPITNYDLTYFNYKGEAVQTQKTDDTDGTAVFTIDNIEDACGYFYGHDLTTNKGFFRMGPLNYSSATNNQNVGYSDVDIYTVDNTVSFTGDENHQNFIFNFSSIYDDFITNTVSYNMPDFICSLWEVSGLSSIIKDSDSNLKIDDDGSFVIKILSGEFSVHEFYIYQWSPIAKEGYEFESWDILGKNYKAGDDVDIDIEDIEDMLIGKVNYKPVSTPEPGPEPEPAPEPGAQTGTAQTGDVTPIAGVIALATVAAIALAISRKRLVIK